LGGGALLARSTVAGGHPAAADAVGTLARRVLGRTGHEVTVLALGTAPCGQSKSVDTPTIMAIVEEALAQGVNFVDTAPVYGNAEEAIGKALGNRRDRVFLATKVWADGADGARTSLDKSLRTLQTDYIDLVYVHSMGNRDANQVLAADGALPYLLQQKETGKIRFVGVSGHSRVASFVPVLETGQIDVVMMAMNFVDRYVYGFEQKVLPVAKRHNVGIACMKVFGGIRGGFRNYDGPNPGPQMHQEYLGQAVRYAMGLPGVATLVIGPHTVEQLRQNVQMVKNYKPLSEAEQATLAELGRKLAQQWGPRYGPVA
jgi:predicted aldo/keto reductase-like oxidoreductase